MKKLRNYAKVACRFLIVNCWRRRMTHSKMMGKNGKIFEYTIYIIKSYKMRCSDGIFLLGLSFPIAFLAISFSFLSDDLIGQFTSFQQLDKLLSLSDHFYLIICFLVFLCFYSLSFSRFFCEVTVFLLSAFSTHWF